MNISKTEALRRASQLFSGVYRAVPGSSGYGFNSWSADHSGWWLPGTTTTYTASLSDRADAIAVCAVRQYLEDRGFDMRKFYAFDQCNGRASERFDRYLVSARRDIENGYIKKVA